MPDALPIKEFRRLDLNSEEMGVPVRRLMDRAGRALAAAVEKRAKKGRIVFLCGKGNNGGDGYAAAAKLHDGGRDVLCVAVGPPGGPGTAYADHLPADAKVTWSAFARSKPKGLGAVVDCLLGSGVRGEPRAPFDDAIRWYNRQRCPRIACDVPSGMGAKLAARPQHTITFHAVKEGMAKVNSGTIEVAPIGIPAKASTHIGLGDLDAGFLRPAAEAHKGDQGHLLIVGGGPFHGAPHYSGMAAYRAGVDLVTLLAPAEAAAVIATWGPHLMVHASNDGDHLTPDALPAVEAALQRASALLIGPGLGTDAATGEAVRQILARAAELDLPVVVDADGLDAIDPAWLDRHGHRVVLTPHGGEFKDLTGTDGTPHAVRAYARRHGCVVLRKGAHDIIGGADRQKTCTRGHVGMTVGGTGDVLAGTVGALLARGADPFDAACAAAYLVGVAGEVAADTWSYGLTATDVIDAIPAVLHRL